MRRKSASPTRKTTEKMSQTLGRIRPTLSYADFGKVDIIIEAVVENPKVKKAVFAEVEPLAEEITPEDRDIVRSDRRRLEALLVPQPEGRGVDSKVPPSMSDEDLVNALAQYLDLESVEKQALLEREGLVARCRSLIDLLEMKVIVSRRAWSSESH